MKMKNEKVLRAFKMKVQMLTYQNKSLNTTSLNVALFHAVTMNGI